MFFENFVHLVNMFFQWWLTSDQILFRRFLEHEEMILSLGLGLGINALGVLTLYLPINFLIPEAKIEDFRSYLQRRFLYFGKHLERLNEYADNSHGGLLFFLKSRKGRGEDVSKLIKTYGYDYLFVFLFSCWPIPFLGTIMTAAALFAVEALKIRFGLLVVIFAKIVKVFGLASIAYFAHFL